MMHKLNIFYNRYPIISIILALILVFLVLFFLLGVTFFNSIKKNTFEEYQKTIQMDIAQQDILINRLLLINDEENIKKSLQPLIDSKRFKEVNVAYDRYIFNQETLVNNTKSKHSREFSIEGVSVDARFGIVDPLALKGWYEFLPIRKGQNNLTVDIKYHAFDQVEVIGFFANLDFSVIGIQEDQKDELSTSFFGFFINFELPIVTSRLEVDGIKYATIQYIPNTSIINENLHDYFISLLVLVILLYFPIVIFIIYYYHRWIHNQIELPLQSVNQYLDNIEHNEYVKFDQEFAHEQMQILVKHIDALTGKIAKAINELNINKETLELKLSSDSITGLPNQDRFELDVKRMFISSVNGYIFLLKIESLGKISQENSSFFTNHYIQEIAKTLKNITKAFTKYDLQLYRFHGSEFAIVLKKANEDDVHKIAQNLIEQLQKNLPEKYHVTQELINIGIAPFDQYGTLESIMKMVQEAYMISKQNGLNSYHLIDFEPFALEYSRLEDEVDYIIENKKFEIDFGLETYLVEDERKLFMKEVTPIINDHKGERLPIGSFISISQKLHKAVEFDKINIEKSLQFLQENNAHFEIAVNLSLETLSNMDFIKWLTQTLKQYESHKKQLVFSITSYSASLHKLRFRNFVQRVHPLGVKILLKRYDILEYPLKDLEDIPIAYIRMKADFTQNLVHDTFKKHKVKNTIIYAQLNNIEVLADSVQYEDDMKFLSRLGVYGASR